MKIKWQLYFKNVHVIKQIVNFLNNFGIDKYLIFHPEDERTQVSPKVIADIYESFIAAVYLVYGIEKASEIVIDLITNYIDFDNINKEYSKISKNKKTKKRVKK